jgi:general secretion pathway protein D
VVKIVPEAFAAQDGGIGPESRGGPDALVTRIIEVRHVSAQELAQWLRPLLPQQGHLAAHADSNTLLVTDRAANVERLERIVARIDRSADAEIEVIPLQHANATEIARTLSSLEQGATPTAPGSAVKLVADARTNSVLLSGERAQRLRLRTLIAHLDTPLAGSDSTEVLFLRYARAEDLVPILEGVAQTLTGETGAEGEASSATILPHGETNALVVTAAPAVIRQLEGIVRQLDIRRAQVLVEAVIVEVNDELADEIGVQWQSTNFDGEEGFVGGTNFPGTTGVGGIIGASQNPLAALGGSSGLNLGYIGGRVTIPDPSGRGEITIFQMGALIKALRGDTRANILSQPSIVTLDHTEAEIKVVQEVQFLTGQYTNTGTGASQPTNPFQTIEREDVGVILTVTPHVNEGDSVRLDIRQEVSSLSGNVAGAVDLITNKRELSTSVLVPDGGLLVLGGLTSEEARETVSGVPGLSRIPLLGNLFKSRSGQRAKRNLMVFLRPHILRDAVTETSLSTDKYNYLRTEQLRLRDAEGSPFRGSRQPVLPPLPQDLFESPPPVLEPVPGSDD